MPTLALPTISNRTGAPVGPTVSAPSPEKHAFVHKLFTTIAPRYDWFNRLASMGLDIGWRRTAIERGTVTPGMRVLDVCCGTGDFALLCARRAAGQGTIAGLDFTHAMLEGAARKQRHERLNVEWFEGDAQALPFADNSFDRVLIGFSTRNLSDLRRGLREMLRVLTPAGRLIILETGRPSTALMRFGYWLYLRTVARAIGFVLTGRIWPFTYLADSVKAFLPPPHMVRLLAECGGQAEYIPLSGGLASLYIARKG